MNGDSTNTIVDNLLLKSGCVCTVIAMCIAQHKTETTWCVYSPFKYNSRPREFGPPIPPSSYMYHHLLQVTVIYISNTLRQMFIIVTTFFLNKSFSPYSKEYMCQQLDNTPWKASITDCIMSKCIWILHCEHLTLHAK